MQINAPFEVVKLFDTRPGDLIRLINHSNGPLGLVIHLAEDERPVVGVLQDASGTKPYHIVFQRNFECIRFNPNWVLDLPHQDAVFGSVDYHHVPGAVHVGSTGASMNFGAADIKQSDLTVNLTSFDWEDLENHDVAFPRWTIWATAEDRTLEGAQPILRFDASSAPD